MYRAPFLVSSTQVINRQYLAKTTYFQLNWNVRNYYTKLVAIENSGLNKSRLP